MGRAVSFTLELKPYWRVSDLGEREERDMPREEEWCPSMLKLEVVVWVRTLTGGQDIPGPRGRLSLLDSPNKSKTKIFYDASLISP